MKALGSEAATHTNGHASAESMVGGSTVGQENSPRAVWNLWASVVRSTSSQLSAWNWWSGGSGGVGDGFATMANDLDGCDPDPSVA